MHAAGVLGDALHALADQAAEFEALLLLASALHKALHWSHLESVVRRFAGVRQSLGPAVLMGVALSEVAAGGLLFVPTLRTSGAWLAAALWTTYLGFLVRAIVQGRREVDCGCSFGATQRPLGAYPVVRNGVLISLALAVVVAGEPATGVQASQLLAACALLALYGALDQVMGLRPVSGGALS